MRSAREQASTARRPRRLEADPEPADLPAPGPLGAVDRVVKPSEYIAGVRKQHLAGCSQLDTAGVPTQELGADLRFQAADSLTQGRLRERQVFGGTAEAQPLGNRNEVTKVAALGHAAMLSVQLSADHGWASFAERSTVPSITP